MHCEHSLIVHQAVFKRKKEKPLYGGSVQERIADTSPRDLHARREGRGVGGCYPLALPQASGVCITQAARFFGHACEENRLSQNLVVFIFL